MQRRLVRQCDAIYLRLSSLEAPAGTAAAGALEWLLDNHYVVRGALNQLGRDLPPGHYRRLPAVRDDGERPVPRLVRMTELLLDATGMPLDLERVESALQRIQDRTPLTLAESWALPVFLRAELLARLAAAALTLLAEPRQRTEYAAQPDTRAPVSVISGCILSLRQLAMFRWADFVERTSLVEVALRQDPVGVYARMDAGSRDRYRKAVEGIAADCGLDEVALARTAVTMAADAVDASDWQRHVGYYLLDDGRDALEARIGCKARLAVRWSRGLHRHATAPYLMLILLPALGLALLACWALGLHGMRPVGVLVFGVVVLVPAISLSTIFGNWLVTQVVPPHVLSRLDFEQGIASDWPAVVVMPVMLANIAEVRRLARNLELNYLGNADPALHFALLTDWPDAPTQTLAGDEETLAEAVAVIDELNERHGGGGQRPFALLHRRRQWNAAEDRWMGWERKRGKLAEFNRLLLAAGETSFQCCHGDLDALRHARSVITLDADTRMPAGVAAALVGIFAHPLNRPVRDPTTGRVLRGYTLVQPRVEIDPASVEESAFARLFAGDVTLDPYVHAVSDVYQDLFGAGIYAGKGAYDLAAFRASVAGRIPDNRVLSHDLLEGVHGRVAYASDVMLLEDFPANLAVMLRRIHRWVRGDWQLLPWLLPSTSLGGRPLSKLAAIDRWKLLDNLRRSLQPVSLLLLLAVVWAISPHPLVWTLLVLVMPGAPAVVQLMIALRGAAWRWGTWTYTLQTIAARVGQELLRWLATLAFLPIEAASNTDAVVRALYRQWVSRRGLLDWETAAVAADRLRRTATVSGCYAQMWPCWAAGLIALLVAAALRPTALVAVLPTAVLWLGAPWLAAVLGRSRAPPATAQLTAAQESQVRELARRTWRFFEQFVGPDSHWLPPDNVQVAPAFAVAYRTSPTNIGLTLLATVSAHDFGYLTTAALLTRLEGTLHTISQLPTYRGHLYNWYGTRDLKPLEPRYVSTVDSGNLVAALMTVSQALRSVGAGTAPRLRIAAGLVDTLRVLECLLGQLGPAYDDEVPALCATLARLQRLLAADPTDWFAVLRAVSDGVSDRLEPGLLRLIERGPDPVALRRLEELHGWIRCLAIQAQSAESELEEQDDLRPRALRLASDIDTIVRATSFRFLFDTRRRLFHIGYNVSAGELDGSYYDLLASEARIASFVAIAKGDVPPVHWMYLGRPLRRVRRHRTLLSWSATAFEYLMPRLLMKTPAAGLLFGSCLVAVTEQRRVAEHLGIPWGISESGYYQTDLQGEYQYRAFGVSQLALRREQSDRIVVAPYASVLALPFMTDAVLANLRALARLGLEGTYGLAEAADFGHPSSDFSLQPRVVSAYMAHHQGMIMTALANAVHDDVMVRRFHSDCGVQSVEYLLYERLPRRPEAQPLQPRVAVRPRRIEAVREGAAWKVDPARPAVNILSNGRLRTVVTAQGGGATYWNDLLLNRWRPEADGEYGGTVVFLRDLDSGELWSLGWDEFGGDALQVEFTAHSCDFRLRRHGLMARLTVAIAADGDLEARRLLLGNDDGRARRLRVVFQAEPVMAREAEDRRHPAFNKMFIECHGPSGPAALLFRRRPRGANEPPLFMGYAAFAHGQPQVPPRCHTQRAAFIGRRGNVRRPAALLTDAGNASEEMAGLDPLAALELDVVIPPLASVECAFLTAVGRDRHHVLELLDRNRSPERIAWLVSQAQAAAQREAALLDLRAGEPRQAMDLARALLWPPRRAQRSAALDTCRAAQLALWSQGLSGDRPVVLLRLRGPEDLAVAEAMLRIQLLLLRRGFEFDLAFLDEASAGYSQPTRDRLAALIEKTRDLQTHERRGLTVIVAGRSLGSPDRAGLAAGASLYLDPEHDEPTRFLAESLAPRILPEFVPVPSSPLTTTALAAVPRRTDLQFDNGYGGFTPDGHEYQVYVEAGACPPTPWVNVIANPVFGAMVSESGLGCTWSGNSSEHRLTPWYNDPVTDRCGENCYLRDEETGLVWSPTPLPLPAASAYRVSHGAGYTRFEHNSQGLEQVLTVFVDPEKALKFIRLDVRNCWPRTRRLTATLAVDWVLGNDRHQTARWLVAGASADGRVLTVRNAFERSHPERTAFLTATLPPHATAANRGDFLGRAHDSRQVPAALCTAWPSSQPSASGEPFGAYQVHLMLNTNERTRVTFVIGEAGSQSAAEDLASMHFDDAAIDLRWRELAAGWDDLLGALQLDTPDAAWNLLGNRWLLYQVVSCRLHGRTGFYQPGGAFGFRDQLQDALALLNAAPDLARQQLLRAAAVQFPEGDVLHWWHTAPLRGVRSRCSDDLLWLPFATSVYVRTTGDSAVLDEPAAYLAGDTLRPGQLEHYGEFAATDQAESLYEHCCRALEARLVTGAHGLPPIGTGDWNDGLNRVGLAGRGESVWLAFFLIHVCRDFAPLCRDRGEPERAARLVEFAEQLTDAVDRHGWDGEWFLRGYYDDGATLGSHADEECHVDLNAQTWAVLAGAAPRERLVGAMRAARQHLSDRDAKVLRLLSPPFDRSSRDPGYIMGYPPGIRENGSQYNHAAAWAVWAAADLGWRGEAREWFDWIHPLRRASSRLEADRYGVEPYVLAGDIYGTGALAGRGGWSWYTGSAGWLYRILIERLLGIDRRGDRLRVNPCLPEGWPGYRARFRHGSSQFFLEVDARSGLTGPTTLVELDGQKQLDEWVPLIDDGGDHRIRVRLADHAVPGCVTRN